MHVAILCEYGTINGGENSILAMIEQLSEIEFSILAPPEGRWGERLATAGLRHVPIRLQSADGHRLPRDEALPQLRSRIDDLAPDLVHANSLSMGRLTGALAGPLSIPTTAHLRDILRLNRAAITDLNRNHLLFAVSRATRDFHVGQGLDASRTEVIYNGIDPDVFQPQPDNTAIRSELGLAASDVLVGAIGQIGLRKGLRVLIDAAITSASTLPHVHYLIAGERFSAKQESIDYERQLHAAAETGGIADRVHWLGYRDDVPLLLNAIDVLVHPALQEPLGRVILEAAACARPIIATNVGGTPEILTDGVSGVLMAPDDSSALAMALQQLLTNPLQCQRLGTAARKVIVNRFEIQTQSLTLADHWHAACAGR